MARRRGCWSRSFSRAAKLCISCERVRFFLLVFGHVVVVADMELQCIVVYTVIDIRAEKCVDEDARRGGKPPEGCGAWIRSQFKRLSNLNFSLFCIYIYVGLFMETRARSLCENNFVFTSTCCINFFFDRVWFFSVAISER